MCKVTYTNIHTFTSENLSLSWSSVVAIIRLLTNTVLLSLLPTTLGSSSELSVSMATPGDDDVMPSRVDGWFVEIVDGVLCFGSEVGFCLALGGGGISVVELETTCKAFSLETMTRLYIHVNVTFLCKYNVC